MRRLRVVPPVGVVLGLVVVAPSTARAAASVHPQGVAQTVAAPQTGAAPRAVTFPRVDHGFRPVWLSIPRVIGRTRVLGLGLDRRETRRAPRLTDQGKWQLGWDMASGTRPGGRRGAVRLNAHTSFAGSALGNRSLSRLRPGARIVATGPDPGHLTRRSAAGPRRSVPAPG